MTPTHRLFALASLLVACGGSHREVLVAGPAPHRGRMAPVSAVARPETSDADYRKGPPPAAAMVPFAPPKIQEARLSNGIRVLWVERHDLPIAAFRLVSEVGTDQSAPALGRLLEYALFKGTKDRALKELNKQLNYLGAWPRVAAEVDSTEVLFKILNYQVDKLSEILSDVVRNATYPGPEVEDARSKQEVAQVRLLEDPSNALRVTADDVLFPAGHAYKHPDVAAIKASSVDQLKKLHARLFDPQHLTIVLAGDVDRATLLPVLEKHFGSVPKGHGAPIVTPPIPTSPASKRVVLVDRAGDTQANLWVVGVGAARTTDGYFPRRVLASLLGKRLHHRLREELGWTYGARCQFDAFRGPGAFYGGGAIDTVHAGEAVREIRAVFEAAPTITISATELAEAKNAVIDSLPRDYETVAETTEAIGTLAVHHLPLDWHATFAANVNAVTTDEVLAAAKKYIHPEMHVVVVGDASKVKSQLEALGIGKVEVRPGPAATWKSNP